MPLSSSTTPPPTPSTAAQTPPPPSITAQTPAPSSPTTAPTPLPSKVVELTRKGGRETRENIDTPSSLVGSANAHMKTLYIDIYNVYVDRQYEV